jgi:hypothetical protein
MQDIKRALTIIHSALKVAVHRWGLAVLPAVLRQAGCLHLTPAAAAAAVRAEQRHLMAAAAAGPGPTLMPLFNHRDLRTPMLLVRLALQELQELVREPQRAAAGRLVIS